MKYYKNRYTVKHLATIFFDSNKKNVMSSTTNSLHALTENQSWNGLLMMHSQVRSEFNNYSLFSTAIVSKIE